MQLSRLATQDSAIDLTCQPGKNFEENRLFEPKNDQTTLNSPSAFATLNLAQAARGLSSCEVTHS
jgi:hypothetical protein